MSQDGDITLNLNSDIEEVGISLQEPSNSMKKNMEFSSSIEDYYNEESKFNSEIKQKSNKIVSTLTEKARRIKKRLNPPPQGSFNKGDQVEKVILAAYEGETSLIRFLVSWRTRKNGIKPRNSFVPSQMMKVSAKKELINYYERKIKWILPE